MSGLNALIRYFIAFCLLLPMYSCAIATGLIYKPAGWRIMAGWNRIFLKLFGVTVYFEYEKQDMDLSSGGVVVGLTQQSLLDATIAISAAPRTFRSIWNIEYALIPFVGWVSFLYGWVIIRQWPAQARNQLKKAENYIRRGGLVYLSIEGKRSKAGSLSPFKKGPVVLAIQSQAKIFPVFVHGSADCLPYGEWKICPGEVTIRFLEPFTTEGMLYEDRDLIIDRLRQLAEQEMQSRSLQQGSKQTDRAYT